MFEAKRITRHRAISILLNKEKKKKKGKRNLFCVKMGEALSGQPLPYIFSLSLFCIISLPYYHSLTGVYDVLKVLCVCTNINTYI